MVAVLRALAGSGFLIASTVLAQAAEPIHLRVADSFPKGHYLVKLVLEPWMEEVKKRTSNAIAFDHYPAQQLGKATDMLKLTQTGVADIGYVAPGYTSDKMPVSEVAMLPGAFEHSCQGTLAYWKLARNGVIAQQDYTPNKRRASSLELELAQGWSVRVLTHPRISDILTTECSHASLVGWCRVCFLTEQGRG